MTGQIEPGCSAVRVGDSPVHGRGVFATRAIEVGEVFCTNHLFRIPAEERPNLDLTSLFDHYFEFEDDAFLALGPISFLNHDDDPNAQFDLDADSLTISLTAHKRILDGDEVSIHYGTDPWW